MSTLGPGGAPAPLITPDLFFELLNEVLVSFGREPLDAASAHKKVIQVLPTDRVLQILAGPGSGKTEVIVWRVLYELFVNLASPTRLLVTTFTNRAATELEIRRVERSDEFVLIAIQRGLGIRDPQVHNLRIGTIHSLCDALLAEYDTTYVEAGTQVIDEAETAVRIARSYRYKLGFSTPPKTPRVLNRLEAYEPLVALFKPPWEEQWPVRMMERVDFIMALLGQQTETWFPRCSASNSPNGIEIVHGIPNLTNDLNKLQTRWEGYLDENQILDFATIQKRFLQQQSKLGSLF